MSNSKDNDRINTGKVRSLKEALDYAKNREADRLDVVVDMKAAEQARLELLAKELQPVFDEIEDADQRFDFALSKGERPRLWVDMTSFVAMGHNKRSYRFLKDTRMGRIVLAETLDMEKAADIVSEYVADKVLERERAMDGEWEVLRKSPNLIKDTQALDDKKNQQQEKTEGATTNDTHKTAQSLGFKIPPLEPANTSRSENSEAWKAASNTSGHSASTPARSVPTLSATGEDKPDFWRSLGWFVFGALCCLAGLAAAAFVFVPDAF